MKRKLLLGMFLVFLAWAATSCEALSNCGFCKNVTYDNGVITNTGAETEYCGTDLITKKATPDVRVGTLVTKVECR
jgi:hypothetical protein